jgi:hypothetical protein
MKEVKKRERERQKVTEKHLREEGTKSGSGQSWGSK